MRPRRLLLALAVRGYDSGRARAEARYPVLLLPICSGGLWRKGDTSGAWQALRSVRLDCDSDALLFTVKQMGTVPAFCHLNTRNCWGEDAGLGALEVRLMMVVRRIVGTVGGR